MDASDELEIRNVIARLAMLTDMGKVDEYSTLVTEDVAWEMPDLPKFSLADVPVGAIEGRADVGFGPGTNTRHVVGTTSVRADGTDQAASESYFQYYADTATTPVVRLFGHYDDTFRRTADGWKLARRKITFG